MNQTYNEMASKPVFPLLMKMAIPPMISMLIQSLYNIVDSIFVAKIGEEALTALSLAYPLQNLSLACSVGIGVAINALIAKNLGAKQNNEANNICDHGIVLALFHSLLFVLMGIFLMKPFFMLFTNDPLVLQYGITYGSIVINDYGIGKDDLLIVVNAYGINSATIDSALTARKNGAKVIGISSVEHASTCPLDHPARHPSKKNLHEIVDCHVDCKVKLGDATIKLEGFEQKIGALSTYANAYVMNSIVVEAINILVNKGINPPVWRSGNCPGGDEWNNQFIERFRGKVRCL